MNKIGPVVGIDSNILVYALNDKSAFFVKTRELLVKLEREDKRVVVTWQNLNEFYAIITDQKRFPGALTAEQATKRIKQLLHGDLIQLVLSNTKTKEIFLDLLVKIKPQRQLVHDVFLAATLISNGVNTLITENTDDFKGVESLRAMRLEEAEAAF